MIDRYGEEKIKIIKEKSPSNTSIIKRRVKKLGLKKVIGQVLFIFFVNTILKRLSKSRIKKIIDLNQLKSQADYIFTSIPSVNDGRIIQLIEAYNPDIIVVNGTRVISKKIIKKLMCPIINIHAGFTTNYRGVHGGYWAIYNGQPELVATTIHHLDSGIDTGQPIRREVFEIAKQDNFSTYPYLHIAAGIRAIHFEIEAFKATGIFSQASSSDVSQFYSHPTISQYFHGWFTKGIK